FANWTPSLRKIQPLQKPEGLQPAVEERPAEQKDTWRDNDAFLMAHANVAGWAP
ncbi:MAG: hypothetical protein ACI9EF_003082, partial [Pseudohongiellaceae bacterium]